MDRADQIRDDVDSWETLMFLYNSALKEVRTKVEILNDEFVHVHNYNPIEYIKSRIKSPESIVKKLKKRMEEASQNLDFEEAMRLRDLIESASKITERQKISNADSLDRDIIAIASDETDAVAQVFFVRNGKMIGREHYHIAEIAEMTEEEILTEFVKRYYTGTPFMPSNIMLPFEIEDMQTAEEWLSLIKGSRVHLTVPKIGAKEKLIELAKNNAELVLQKDKEKIIREEQKTIGATGELQKMLGLDRLVRIEAFDISNTNGFENVGSMVVFENGKPTKSDYRKFKIRSVDGPDDYSCMYEVLTRRFRHGMEERKQFENMEMDTRFGGFSRFPDLILMDGGKGQVNVANKVLTELGIDIPVCGMVKDDRHRTRGLYSKGVEIDIDTHSEAFKLITRVQDEAHRFAIEFHKSLRSKKQVKSILDDIPGVGPSRKRSLMRSFENIDEIKNADVQRLCEAEDIPENVARTIYEFFHKT